MWCLVPFADMVSVSQKIKSTEERLRLKRLVSSIKPKNFGIIVRTVADGKRLLILTEMCRNLVAKWKASFELLSVSKPPVKILGELNRTSTILRDSLNQSYNSIWVNDADMYEEIRNYISEIAPDKVDIAKHYKGKAPIFENFGIDKANKAKLWKNSEHAQRCLSYY